MGFFSLSGKCTKASSPRSCSASGKNVFWAEQVWQSADWGHYPYKGSNGAYIECKKAGDIPAGAVRCGPASNTRDMPATASIIPAVHTSTYTKIGTWNNCDFSCAEMISANYVGAGLTYKGSGFLFVDAVNATWNSYMANWYASHPVEPQYIIGKTDYKVWVQSIWRNPERQEAESNVINSDHQFGSGVDFSHKNSFGDGRPIYENGSDRAATNICLVAWAAWDSGGTKQTLVENVQIASPIYFEWQSGSDMNSCITEVNSKIVDCLDPTLPQNASQQLRTKCSPTHVHSARPND